MSAGLVVLELSVSVICAACAGPAEACNEIVPSVLVGDAGSGATGCAGTLIGAPGDHGETGFGFGVLPKLGLGGAKAGVYGAAAGLEPNAGEVGVLAG